MRVATTFTRNGSTLAAITNAPTTKRYSYMHPAGIGRVVRDAARHARDPQEVLREERQVEADEVHPEMDLAQPLTEAAAGHLGEPVGGGEDAEHAAAEEDVVQVSTTK